MAIAGVEPVGSVLAHENFFLTTLTPDEDYYTESMVRDILIKFASKVEAFDEQEPPFVPDIDEFMNHN